MVVMRLNELATLAESGNIGGQVNEYGGYEDFTERYYVIRHLGRGMCYDGEREAWSKDPEQITVYRPGEFPATIRSLEGEWDLTYSYEADGVPWDERYDPPEDYLEMEREWDEGGLPPGLHWLTDEYGDSLYKVIQITDPEQLTALLPGGKVYA